jgi:hypothetical protein
MDTKVETSLAEALNHWSDIEGYIKQIESINSKLITATINELRYAGRLLVAALSNYYVSKKIDEEQLREKIIVARQYLYNAEHDATDSIIAHYSARVRHANETFGTNFIISKTPDYKRYLDTLSEAKQKIQESRRDSTQRIAIYKKLRQVHVKELVDLDQTLTDIGLNANNILYRYSEELILLTEKYRISRFIGYALFILVVAQAIFFGWS